MSISCRASTHLISTKLKYGMNVINPSIKKAKSKNGAAPRNTSETETFPMALSVNKFKPIGGVTAAISMFIIIIIAKWIGFMPSIFINGKNMGRVINNAEITSKNIPKKSSNIFTQIKNKITLSLCSVIHFTIV